MGPRHYEPVHKTGTYHMCAQASKGQLNKFFLA